MIIHTRFMSIPHFSPKLNAERASIHARCREAGNINLRMIENVEWWENLRYENDRSGPQSLSGPAMYCTNPIRKIAFEYQLVK